MDNEEILRNINRFIEKLNSSKKEEKMDLSSDEDLSIAIMNLISIEEHFFFTGAKTGKSEYYDLIQDVRKIRKELLKKIIKEYEGEVWCISKHLLAASYRLMEVGTKELDRGNKKEAYALFDKAYAIYSLFWGLNLKLIDVSHLKKMDLPLSDWDKEKILGKPVSDKDSKSGKERNEKDKNDGGVLKKFGDLVKKAIDCCIE
jgi:hypothetical protein